MTLKRHFVTFFLAVAGLAAEAVAAAAEDSLALSFPVKCTVGETCWIVQYPDVDPAPGHARDFTCGNATYDGHKGTDIAIAGVREMRKGVPVVAAADGKVVGTRNGERDEYLKRVGKDAVRDKECGNGVRIDHGGGWYSQYCHMRQGSVGVATGQTVRRGDALGLVGLSGQADFVHLHIQVGRGDKVYDPFLGNAVANDCGGTLKPLWRDVPKAVLDYRPTAIYHAGFAGLQPKEDAVLDGLLDDEVLPVRSPALVLWAEVFHVKRGDRLALAILGPKGETIFSTDKVLPADKARMFLYGGKKASRGSWPAGVYAGEIVLTRDAGVGRAPERHTARHTVTLK